MTPDDPIYRDFYLKMNLGLKESRFFQEFTAKVNQILF